MFIVEINIILWYTNTYLNYKLRNTILRFSYYYGGNFMALKKGFLCKQVFCETLQLERLIKKWTEKEGWKFANFADFLKLMGIKTPVILSDLNVKAKTFKCITADNSEITICLFFAGIFDIYSSIKVTTESTTMVYRVNTNLPYSKSVPQVTLTRKIIKRGSKELLNDYSQYYCRRILKFDDIHTLKVEFREPVKHEQTSEVMVLRNCIPIERYLLDLKLSSLTINKVYEMLVELLGFTPEDIYNCSKILVSLVETINGIEHVHSQILLHNGIIQ